MNFEPKNNTATTVTESEIDRRKVPFTICALLSKTTEEEEKVTSSEKAVHRFTGSTVEMQAWPPASSSSTSEALESGRVGGRPLLNKPLNLAKMKEYNFFHSPNSLRMLPPDPEVSAEISSKITSKTAEKKATHELSTRVTEKFPNLPNKYATKETARAKCEPTPVHKGKYSSEKKDSKTAPTIHNSWSKLISLFPCAQGTIVSPEKVEALEFKRVVSRPLLNKPLDLEKMKEQPHHFSPSPNSPRMLPTYPEFSSVPSSEIMSKRCPEEMQTWPPASSSSKYEAQETGPLLNKPLNMAEIKEWNFSHFSPNLRQILSAYPEVSSVRSSKSALKNPIITRALASSVPKRHRGVKKPIPESQKDGKYFERRKLNNVAAKKSRDARKTREDQTAMRANILEKENAVLRAQVSTLREEAESLRQLVIQKRTYHTL